MSGKIFAGLKVLDFTWAAAGPIATKQLADNGATVIKVESTRHPDSVRLGGPFKGDTPGINRSGFFADFNSSKLGIAVDTGHPRAREIIAPLVAWADIVAESFRPGVMARWGLDYEQLRDVNPKLIMLSTSLYGANGPWSRHPGYGAQGAALSGLHGLTGWPDRPPAAPKGAYTDSVSPRFMAAALVAALIHREKTGEGQHIEVSQIEATLTFLTPQILEYQATGHAASRAGNADPRAVLHGVFPCAGDDRWIAIEVWTEGGWAALLSVLDARAASDQILRASPDIRARDTPRVEDAIGRLTHSWNAFELMAALREVGVAAGVAIKGSDLLSEETLEARGHFWELDHPEMGRLAYNGPAYRFERTPSELKKAAPCLGEDTDYVLEEILSMTPEKIAEYRSAGVLV
jgi:benzylsuccinate CoA-transferase BbsF subunit